MGLLRDFLETAFRQGVLPTEEEIFALTGKAALRSRTGTEAGMSRRSAGSQAPSLAGDLDEQGDLKPGA